MANCWLLEERVGFEPTRLAPGCFQDNCLKPLGHLSKTGVFTCGFGRRDRNRTCNLRFWRPLLCLIELPAYRPSSYHTGSEFASSAARQIIGALLSYSR